MNDLKKFEDDEILYADDLNKNFATLIAMIECIIPSKLNIKELEKAIPSKGECVCGGDAVNAGHSTWCPKGSY